MRSVIGIALPEDHRQPASEDVSVSLDTILKHWNAGRDTAAIRHALINEERVIVPEAEIYAALAAHRDASQATRAAA